MAHVFTLHLLRVNTIFNIHIYHKKCQIRCWKHKNNCVCCRLVLCCCLIPFFMNRFKDAYHTCPRCNKVLHVEKRKCCKWWAPAPKVTHGDMKKTSSQQSVWNVVYFYEWQIKHHIIGKQTGIDGVATSCYEQANLWRVNSSTLHEFTFLNFNILTFLSCYSKTYFLILLGQDTAYIVFKMKACI